MPSPEQVQDAVRDAIKGLGLKDGDFEITAGNSDDLAKHLKERASKKEKENPLKDLREAVESAIKKMGGEQLLKQIMKSEGKLSLEDIKKLVNKASLKRRKDKDEERCCDDEECPINKEGGFDEFKASVNKIEVEIGDLLDGKELYHVLPALGHMFNMAVTNLLMESEGLKALEGNFNTVQSTVSSLQRTMLKTKKVAELKLELDAEDNDGHDKN